VEPTPFEQLTVTPTGQTANWWFYPLIPALASAVLMLAWFGLTLASAGLAVAFIVLALVAGYLLTQRSQADMQTTLAEHRQTWQQHYRDEVNSFFAGLNRIEHDITSVWSRQIETGRSHTEQAINELAGRFNGIVERLDDAVRSSGASDSSAAEYDVVKVLRDSHDKLHSVEELLHIAMQNRDALLTEVGNLLQYIGELKGMADDVASIAAQTNMLALNAAIEAARAGSSGRGFAVVADEVRTLSSKSGETGQSISETVKIISSAITNAFATAEQFAKEDVTRSDTAKRNINAVLDDFRRITEHLEDSANTLRTCSVGIKSDVAQSLVQFQFQDRVSQILGHVRDNIEAFPRCLEASEQAFAQDGRLQAIDWSGLQEDLKRSYATQEEHRNHADSQRRAGAHAPTDTSAADSLTFF
jgi:methyl-accepting chemotaxis protein